MQSDELIEQRLVVRRLLGDTSLFPVKHGMCINGIEENIFGVWKVARDGQHDVALGYHGMGAYFDFALATISANDCDINAINGYISRCMHAHQTEQTRQNPQRTAATLTNQLTHWRLGAFTHAIAVERQMLTSHTVTHRDTPGCAPCVYCFSMKTMSLYVQMRAGDEGMTEIRTCDDCRRNSKHNT